MAHHSSDPTINNSNHGSARQLFQRLQGPMEEDTLKYHFEKTIMPHGSHALALSQVCPNNLNGGPVLTPLDLCDVISPSENLAPIGYQGPHAEGLSGPNNGTQASIGSGSSPAYSLPGSSAMGLGNHLASASTPLSPALR
ncbi:hypothetical protein M8C21_013368 [Ambrosia artemisiifolia]|uniref:Uncharacterized protein n=1 Tax=Ambrosia artemisiifolia TaxID=4212 RepID=A0AAD5D028_AMBAR|nr:hypothetical protein M8C21_013368 [Ambrosia artemisiifolia]